MQLISWFWLITQRLGLGLCALMVLGSPQAQADLLGDISSGLDAVVQTVDSVESALVLGTDIVNDVAMMFGTTVESSTASSAGVPNVPNGGILAGPGNSSYGISYLRDVFLPNITNWVVAVILAGSVIVIIIGGFMYVLGGGNQETTDKGRETIIWGIIGTVVTMAAYAIVRIIISINFLG